MVNVRVGNYVTHSQRPAWGLGKVFGQNSTHVLVGFAGVPEEERFKRLQWSVGLLDRASVSGNPELDSWKVECDSTCHYINAVAKPKRNGKVVRWSRNDAMDQFLDKFSGGFPDAWYRSSVRADHVARHERWKALLSGDKLREFAEGDPFVGGQAILDALTVSSRPLLSSPAELTRLREAFNNDHTLRLFLASLATLLEAERVDATVFDNYIAAFTALEKTPRKKPLPWPLVTALPFMAQPNRHIHVRPKLIRKVATGMGFDLQFHEKPNFKTYSCMLAFGSDLLEFIKPRSGMDMIDVVSLINVTAE